MIPHDEVTWIRFHGGTVAWIDEEKYIPHLDIELHDGIDELPLRPHEDETDYVVMQAIVQTLDCGEKLMIITCTDTICDHMLMTCPPQHTGY